MSNNNKPTLLVLAAGMGSRYGSLKQMDSFGPNGEAIIDYSIYDAIKAGFGKVVFIVREYFKDDFKKVFDAKFADKIEVHYVCQELNYLPDGLTFNEAREKPWGTAHAVWVANEVINEPFAVINADDFYGRDAFMKVANFLNSDDSQNFCVVAYFLDNTLSEHGYVNRGVCKADEHGNLITVQECTKISKEEGVISYPHGDATIQLTPNTLVSMNLWGFKPSYFSFAEKQLVDFIIEQGNELKSEFYIPSVIDKLIQDETLKVKVLSTDSSWFGVTYPEDKPSVISQLHKLIDENEYPKNLWN